MMDDSDFSPLYIIFTESMNLSIGFTTLDDALGFQLIWYLLGDHVSYA